jgi:hypothetical protein
MARREINEVKSGQQEPSAYSSYEVLIRSSNASEGYRRQRQERWMEKCLENLLEGEGPGPSCMYAKD